MNVNNMLYDRQRSLLYQDNVSLCDVCSETADTALKALSTHLWSYNYSIDIVFSTSLCDLQPAFWSYSPIFFQTMSTVYTCHQKVLLVHLWHHLKHGSSCVLVFEKFSTRQSLDVVTSLFCLSEVHKEFEHLWFQQKQWIKLGL